MKKKVKIEKQPNGNIKVVNEGSASQQADMMTDVGMKMYESAAACAKQLKLSTNETRDIINTTITCQLVQEQDQSGLYPSVVFANFVNQLYTYLRDVGFLGLFDDGQAKS